jgi:hypothetical protein
VSICLSIRASIRPSICTCLSVCPSVRLFAFLVIGSNSTRSSRTSSALFWK